MKIYVYLDPIIPGRGNATACTITYETFLTNDSDKCWVRLYSEDNYKGTFEELTSSGDVMTIGDVSSVSMSPKCCVVVFADKGLTGQNTTFCYNNATLKHWNDRIASVKLLIKGIVLK